MLDDNITRRGVLRSAAAAGGIAFGAGAVSGQEGPEELNIGIDPGASAAERAAKRRADSVRKTIDFGDIGKVVVGKFSEEAADALENRPGVQYVEPNYTATKLGEKLPWGIDRVDADVLHSEGTTGSGATIAILDTGVDDDHEDLSNNVDPSLGAAFGSECGSESGGCRFGLEGYNGNDCNYKWSDDDDHGSHVAGTADAVRGNSVGVAGGVSTEATIMPVKVLSGCGSGSYSDIADGIKYATDNGADVINMSLGGSSGDSTLKNACQYAYDNGVLLVAAAGNDGPCSDCVSYPAKYSTVMAISATDSDDTLADYSSTGPEVELAGPGTDVLSTIPPESDDGSTYADGYETFSGTSMATPHAAGAAGQVFANSSLTNKEIRQQLKDSAEDIGLASNEQGAGLVDAEKAVDSLSSDNAPTVDSLSLSEVETSDSDAEFDASWQVSDSDGDLSGVDLTLTDDTDSETEDTASVSVSGDSASGTTRLVAADDENSGNSYTVELVVTDSNSNSASDTATASESENPPTVDSLSASEVETSDSDAEFDVDWQVSDSDGDLSSVDLALTDDTDSESEDSASISVSGDSASGTTRLVAAGDDGSGNSYTVDITVTDGESNTASDSTTVSETEDTSSAPTVDSHAVSTRTTGPWYRVTADWAVSDDDGDLDSVDVAIEDSNGKTLNSTTVDVSGSSASGSNELKARSKPSTSVVTVTDSKGNSDTSSKSVSF